MPADTAAEPKKRSKGAERVARWRAKNAELAREMSRLDMAISRLRMEKAAIRHRLTGKTLPTAQEQAETMIAEAGA